jgi:DNA primase small subunit
LEQGTESTYFTNREFSFTLENDVYCRYLSFKTGRDFHTSLVERCPFKIDIGAVFNFPPSSHLTAEKTAFVPLEKEMVFDIDMTDYDDVRTCCGGAKVCERCWQFMVVATKIMYDNLTEDFGFKCLLWVFSGRRGIHCWVSDEEARTMTNEQRAAVTEYCNMGVGNELAGRLQVHYPIHPMLKRAYKTLYPEKFEEIIIHNQDLLA